MMETKTLKRSSTNSDVKMEVNAISDYLKPNMPLPQYLPYRSQKPLIVTTNLTLDEIRHPQDTAHARIYDRLLEMCIPVSCIGVSFRKENVQEKLERMKLLIG